jgi:hypothetical protein
VCRGEGSSAVWPAALAVGPSVWSQPVCLGFTGHTHENQDTHTHTCSHSHTQIHTLTQVHRNRQAKFCLWTLKNR